MSRFLGLVVLAVLLWLVLEAAWGRLRLSLGATARQVHPPPPAPPAPVTATLVRCAGCGVHVPRESLVEGRCGRCSQAASSP